MVLSLWTFEDRHQAVEYISVYTWNCTDRLKAGEPDICSMLSKGKGSVAEWLVTNRFLGGSRTLC